MSTLSLNGNTSNGNSRRKLYKEIPFKSLRGFCRSHDISSVSTGLIGFNVGVYYYV